MPMILMLMVLLLAPGIARAAAVLLQWSPSSSASAVGYEVHYGAGSHAYTTELNTGAATSATIAGLEPGHTYFFGVLAYDAQSRESPYSNEVSYAVPPAATAAYTLTPSPTTVRRRESVSLTWTAPPEATPTDWIGLYPQGADDEDFLWWTYTEGRSSGRVIVTMPNRRGPYVFRYHVQDSYLSVKESVLVTVR